MAQKKHSKRTKTPDKLLNFSHGKDEDVDLEKVRNLESLIGITTQNPFRTTDAKVLEQKLKESSLADLQRLCEKVGIFPHHEKNRLKDQLRKEFRRITKGARVAVLDNQPDISDPSHPEHEKAKNLLSKGL